MNSSVLLPEAVLAGVAALGVVALRLRPAPAARWLPAASIAAVLVALVLELTLGAQVGGLFRVAHGTGFVQDRFALFVKAAVLLSAAVALGCADWEVEDLPAAPFTLLASLGVMIAASAGDLAVLWAGLELTLFACAALAGHYSRSDGLRLLTGCGVGAAVVAFGFALLYGVTGFSTLDDIRRVMAFEPVSLPLGIAVALVVLGLAPALVLPAFRGDRARRSSLAQAILSSLGVGAAAVVLFKVLATVGDVGPAWSGFVLGLGAAAMVAGAVGAVASGPGRMTGARQLVAYAALVQAGWLLAGLATHSRLGAAAGIFLLGSYMVASAVAPGQGRGAVGRAALGLGLLSLAGVPPLGGWFGDFAVALELARSGAFWLLGIGLFASILLVIGVLRLLRGIYLGGEPATAAVVGRPGFMSLSGVSGIAGMLVLLAYGLFAFPVHSLALQGAAALGLR